MRVDNFEVITSFTLPLRGEVDALDTGEGDSASV